MTNSNQYKQEYIDNNLLISSNGQSVNIHTIELNVPNANGCSFRLYFGIQEYFRQMYTLCGILSLIADTIFSTKKFYFNLTILRNIIRVHGMSKRTNIPKIWEDDDIEYLQHLVGFSSWVFGIFSGVIFTISYDLVIYFIKEYWANPVTYTGLSIITISTILLYSGFSSLRALYRLNMVDCKK